MDIFQILGFLSGIVSAICFLPYVRDILLNKTKPERASWLIWSALGLIAFFSQLSKGASNSLWMPGVQTFGVLMIFLLSLKFGEGRLKKRDVISLVIAGFGLIIWFLTKEPIFALAITIFVDMVGALLTTVKAYEDPESETMSTWLLSSLAGLIAAFAVGEVDYVLLAYPIYIFVINLLVVVAMVLGRNKLAKV
jgi:hypothetical protein